MSARNGSTKAADDLKEAAAGAQSEMSDQLGALRSRIEELARMLAETGEYRAKAAAATARSAAKGAMREAGRGYEYAADQAEEARTAATRMTAERPAMALGLAAALGLLAGIALMRR